MLVLPLGQRSWYEAPSNPLLVNVQPDTLYTSASLPGKQKMSSLSGACLLTLRPSWSPVGHVVGLPWGSSPNGVAGIFTGPVQNWKCPISVSIAALYEPAAQVTRVLVLDVLYMGWKLVGMAVQDVPLGSNLTSAKPLALLAVIDPDWPVVASSSVTLK